MKKITRDEMWELIVAKVPELKNFGIGGAFGDTYIPRETLLKLMSRLEIPKHFDGELKERYLLDISENI